MIEEQIGRGVDHRGDLGRLPAREELVGEPGGDEGPIGVAQHRLHARAGDAHAEEIGGHVLELVGLVEDHRVVGRERARDGEAPLLGGDLHGEIGEEQRVIDDHDPRLIHVATHPRDEALGVVLAALTGQLAAPL